MYTTFHLSSADELTPDIVEAIKTAFKLKPITITVEEKIDATAYLMTSPANKEMLEKSIAEDKSGKHILVKHNDL